MMMMMTMMMMIYAYKLLDIGKLKCTRVRQGQKDVDTYRKHRGFFPYLFEDEFGVPSLIYLGTSSIPIGTSDFGHEHSLAS